MALRIRRHEITPPCASYDFSKNEFYYLSSEQQMSEYDKGNDTRSEED